MSLKDKLVDYGITVDLNITSEVLFLIFTSSEILVDLLESHLCISNLLPLYDSTSLLHIQVTFLRDSLKLSRKSNAVTVLYSV